MSKCSNTNIGKMLHLYELGLLSEEDLQKFELHLLDCDFCYNNVQKFKPIADHINHYPEVRSTINTIVNDEEQSAKTKSTDNISKSIFRKPRLLPISTALLIIAIVVFLIIKPWKIEFQTDNAARATENLIAIMYFNDLSQNSDSYNYGEIVTSLLITDLSESDFISVISSQRLYDILKLMGREGQKVINEDVAFEVAKKANAKWMLIGEILQTVPQIIITSQLIDVSTGVAVASQKVTGDIGEDIFSLIDELSLEVKSDLSLPLDAYKEPDIDIAKATTNSIHAYSAYLKGVDLYNQLYFREAILKFEEALSYDSTFAMAYYYLSRSQVPPINNRYISLAKKYASNLNRKEKSLIDIQNAMLNKDSKSALSMLYDLIRLYPNDKEAHYLIAEISNGTGDYNNAVLHLDKAIEIDPLYKNAYNLLSYVYANLNDLDNAIHANDKYIELVPDEANPYDTRGEIYMKFGKIDNAIESYENAIRIKSDYSPSSLNLAKLYLFKYDNIKADSVYNKYLVARGFTENPQKNLYSAYILLNQGQIQKAIVQLNRGLNKYIADSSLARDDIYNLIHATKIRILEDCELTDELSAEMDDIEALKGNSVTVGFIRFSIQQIEFLANSGNLIRAEDVAEDLRKYIDSHTHNLTPYWYSEGYIEFSKNNLNGAEQLFLKAAEGYDDYLILYMLSQIQIRLDKYKEASETLEKLLYDCNLWDPIWSVKRIKAYYYLGLAYELDGKTGDAIDIYSKLLDLYKNADDDIAEIHEAEKRLGKLKTRP